MRTWLFVPFILMLSSSLFAKETDNLTGRYKRLEDSTEIMDKEMNKRLQALAEKASSKKISCDDSKSVRILFHEMNPPKNMIGDLETWAEENAKISKRKATPESSVYAGVLSNGWLFNKIDLASTVKVNGQLIGTDKFGHFLDQGYTLYTTYRRANYDLYPALTGSIGSEGSALGGKSTGTKSYADSMANYHGIMFYHRLTEGNNAYLKCVGGQWTHNDKFTFVDYVDAGWDEGINCSQIVDEKSRAVYETNLKKLEADSKTRGREDSFHCPVDMEACGKLRHRYVAYEKFVLSPECRKATRIVPSSSGGSGGSSGPGKATK